MIWNKKKYIHIYQKLSQSFLLVTLSFLYDDCSAKNLHEILRHVNQFTKHNIKYQFDLLFKKAFWVHYYYITPYEDVQSYS